MFRRATEATPGIGWSRFSWNRKVGESIFPFSIDSGSERFTHLHNGRSSPRLAQCCLFCGQRIASAKGTWPRDTVGQNPSGRSVKPGHNCTARCTLLNTRPNITLTFSGQGLQPRRQSKNPAEVSAKPLPQPHFEQEIMGSVFSRRCRTFYWAIAELANSQIYFLFTLQAAAPI